MTTLKVKDKEYKLKFGYKSFKNSGILKEVVEMQKKLSNAKENDESDIATIEEVFDLNSKLVLAALQKNHEEFRANYKDQESVEKKIEMVDDLMDEYMDEEDSMSIMDLFGALTEELFNNGFLSSKSENLEKSAKEQNATVVPTDHKKKEN